MFGFNKKKPTEESVEWSPPDTVDGYDELKLCQECPFKGRCSFTNGCKPFRQVKENRLKKLGEIRGVDWKKSSQIGQTTFSYLHGVSWRHKTRDGQMVSILVVRVEDQDATVSAKILHNKDTRRNMNDNRSFEFVIGIPYELNKNGKPIVDLHGFKTAVVTELRKQLP